MNRRKMICFAVAACLALSLLAACGDAASTGGADAGHEAGHDGGHDHGHGGDEHSSDGHANDGYADDGDHSDGNGGDGHHSDGHGGDGDPHSGGHGEEHAEGSGAQASFAFPGGAPKAGQSAALDIRITDADGSVIEHFEVSHEKLMHLIVVSEDLAHFAHLHPAYEGGGVFGGEATFPTGGRYKMFADFVPTGGAATTIGGWIDVEGEVDAKPLQPDAALAKKAEGVEVELTIDGLKAEADSALTFRFRDASTGKPVDDLEPYLGAIGHVVVVSADAEQYLHVHPSDESSSGPTATFLTSFPGSGVYKIWGQFQRDGKLMTLPFTIEVP
ncbi:hypothetical protein MO973_15405 [Paenibacillus sp. TRM 82003]|nr:hypothetical protein [Paenibacillus sp. TRM 82003]